MKKPRAGVRPTKTSMECAGFSTFGEDLITLLDFYCNVFKRLNISTQCDFQSHNKIGEQVDEEPDHPVSTNVAF